MMRATPTEETIFAAALEKTTPVERAQFLADACGEDSGLRSRVERLLQSHEEAGSFLRNPYPPLVPTAEHEPMAERPGSILGPYKLLHKIGEGGMGVVFMAEQTQPVHRKVALKIIKPGMDSRQV